MKILQINNCHYRRGGADIVYLETGMLLERRGNEVSYFSTKSDRNEISKFSEYFITVENPLNLNFFKQLLAVKSNLYSKISQKNLDRLIKDERPDIAHLHLFKGALTASILKTLKSNKIPIVITLHDYSLLCPRNIFYNAKNEICEKCSTGNPINCLIHKCNRNNLFYSLTNYIEYLICNKIYKPQVYFDKIICVSKFNFQKHLVSKPVLDNKLVHLYNFSSLLDKKVSNQSHKNYFLYFGRLSDEKGIITLIKAFQEAQLSQKLLIVGTGPLKSEISALTSNDPNIEVLGYKTGESLDRIIAEAMFVVVPSEWYENNPLTIIESYSLGTPVIGSNIGGIPELIVGNETGFTFEMGNYKELSVVLEKASKLNIMDYQSMSQNATKFAISNFSENSHYLELIRIYEDAISKYGM